MLIASWFPYYPVNTCQHECMALLGVCLCVLRRKSTHREEWEPRQDQGAYARELVFFHYVGYAAATNLECVLISLSHRSPRYHRETPSTVSAWPHVHGPTHTHTHMVGKTNDPAFTTWANHFLSKRTRKHNHWEPQTCNWHVEVVSGTRVAPRHGLSRQASGASSCPLGGWFSLVWN